MSSEPVTAQDRIEVDSVRAAHRNIAMKMDG